MTVEELILLDKAKVRRDSNLMHLYLEFFKEAFNRVPNCAGCSFATDWQKLVSKYSKKSVTLQKVNPMKTITIKKIQGKILSYKKDGKTFRLYDNILTDAFIKEYISNGTEEEILERKKMFNFPVEEEIKTILLVEDKNGIKAFDEKGDEKEVIKNNNFNHDTSKVRSNISENTVKKRGRKAKK